jgi:carbon-monoxide dehydrogenase medium subunit
MQTAAFRYHRARDVGDAESLFRSAPDARFISGGQSLIPMMKQRLAAPGDLVDLSRIAALSFVRRAEGLLTIGSGTKHADVAASADVQKAIPALAALAAGIGDPAVRHRGTIGGSIANNDPAADYPAAVLALNAHVQTTKRLIDADAFFTGMFATALNDGEIVTEINFPVPKQAAYQKFRNQASRYAMVGVFVARFDHGVRVAVTGAAPCVFRVSEMEAALTKSFTPDAVAKIGVPADGLNSDIHGSAEYRAHLITVMAKRAVAQALG